MNHLESIRELMATTFGVAPEQISASTSQADIPEWDSVGHLNLMMAIEDAHGVRMTVEDMTRLSSVQAILTFLEEACPST